MILSALQQMVADFCGDADQTRFGGQYVSRINRAQEQFALDTRALFKDKAYTSTANSATLGSLPTDFLFEESVNYNGLPLDPISRNTLKVLYPDTDWTLLSGTPKFYMIDPEEANKIVRLIPYPTEAKSAVMRYYPLPAAVAAGTDVVLNSSALLVQFHMAIAAFAAWLTLSSEPSTPSIETKCAKLLKLYEDGCAKAIELYGNTASEGLRIRPK